MLFFQSFVRRLQQVFQLPWRTYQWLMVIRPIQFTRFGLLYILFTIAVGAAAINTGNNLLYLMLGIQLGMIVVSGVLSDSALWGLETEWMLVGTAYVGEPVSFRLSLLKHWFPAVLLKLTASWNTGKVCERFIYWLPVREKIHLELTTVPERRGFFRLQTLRYTSQFPFGFFQKFHSTYPEAQWIAYPRRQAVEHVFESQAFAASGNRTRLHPGAGDTSIFLREYREGDSLRYVHWKSSAKRGRVLIREMSADISEPLWFVITSWPKDLSFMEQEDFISFAASFIQQSYNNGRLIGLETPDAVWNPEHSHEQLERLLRYLALVDVNAPTTRPRPKVSATARGRLDALALWRIHRGAID